jgi:rSAM/selenodomain-associated transferase 2
LILSVIIPVLNEASTLRETLPRLQGLRAAGHEIIVSDGGSIDGTRELAAAWADQVLCGPAGRARQMNKGAGVAGGQVLLFLHADTRLPDSADRMIRGALQDHVTQWGRFDVRLSGPRTAYRVIETLMNLRSRWSGIATGDQAVFVRRRVFETVGGFPDIALMEDVALSRLLRARCPPVCLKQCVITSSRRWESRGIARTIVLMWRLRLAYFLGADPERLARAYNKP